MKTICFICLFAWLAIAPTTELRAQDAKPLNDTAASPTAVEKSYSGMYTFLKEGEFVQVSVEDAGHVTGFISRYGDGESDTGVFLDQFFKTGKLEGNKLAFTTQLVHGVTYDFKGTIERGEGKNPGDEAYYVLKGRLTKNMTDAEKKASSHSQEVRFKMFPEEAQAAPR
jgi:hypothetical protein